MCSSDLSIDYNITLRLVNKGGSNASYSNITDSDYSGSIYNIGTIEAGSYAERSYIKEFTRNSSSYNASLSIASGSAIDSYTGSVISANSSGLTVIVP